MRTTTRTTTRTGSISSYRIRSSSAPPIHHWWLFRLLCAVSLLTSGVHADWLMQCAGCHCKWNSGKKTADCKNTSIARIPLDLSPEMQVLDVSANPQIADIQAGEFITADLRNLHKLYMRNCSLRTINREAMRGLEILIELDVSFNQIRGLPRGAFGALVKLRALIMNNNQLERLEDGLFRNLKFLHKIEMKENRLVRIEPKAFTNLPLLTQIYLDGNRLTVLRRESFESLEKLTSLSLKLNPWNCTCDLKSFRDFAFQQNLYTPPTDCHYPVALRGTLWIDVSHDAFACKPELVVPAAAATTQNAKRDNVTLSCRVYTSPNTVVTWLLNRHPFSNPKRIFIRNVSEVDEKNAMELLTSELTIVGVQKADEGVYNCVSQNAGGRTEANIQLTVHLDTNAAAFLRKHLVLVLVAIGLIVLFVCAVISLLTCCCCRKLSHQLAKQEIGGGGGGGGGGGIGHQQQHQHQSSHPTDKTHFNAVKLNAADSNAGHHTTTLLGSRQQSQEMDGEMQRQPDGEAVTSVQLQSHQHHHPYQQQQQQQLQQMQPFAQQRLPNGRPAMPMPKGGGYEVTAADRQTSNRPIGSDMQEIKCTVSADKTIIELPSKNGLIVSPSRPSHHQHQSYLYDTALQSSAGADTRLPPDLLPYGQQSVAIPSNGGGSSADHTPGSGQYHSYDSTTILYKDYKDCGHTVAANNYEVRGALRGSTQDLHINFKDCLGMGGGSSSALIGSSVESAGGAGGTLLRHINRNNNYTLSSAATVLQSTVAAAEARKAEPTFKARQSIVRTSPSFSFLSNGGQQSNNFL